MGGEDVSDLIRDAQRQLGIALGPLDGGQAARDEASDVARLSYLAVIEAATGGNSMAQNECRRVYLDPATVGKLPLDPCDLLAGVAAGHQPSAFEARELSSEVLVRVADDRRLRAVRPIALERMFTVFTAGGDGILLQYLLSQPDTDRQVHRSVLDDGRLLERAGVPRHRVVACLTPAELERVLISGWALGDLRGMWRILADVPRRRVLGPALIKQAALEADLDVLAVVAQNDDPVVAEPASDALLRMAPSVARRVATLTEDPTIAWVSETSSKLIGLDDAVALASERLTGPSSSGASLQEALARWEEARLVLVRSLERSRMVIAVKAMERFFAGPVGPLSSWYRQIEHQRRLLVATMEHADPASIPASARTMVDYVDQHGLSWARDTKPGRPQVQLGHEASCHQCGSWLVHTWRYCGTCGSPLH